jgi:hypothetical protein
MGASMLRSGFVITLLLATSGEGGRSPSSVPEGPAPPERTPGLVRVVNVSRYPLVDLRLNEAQHLERGQSLPIGSVRAFPIEPGRLEYAFGAGFWSGRSRQVWFGTAGRTLVAPGQTVTVSISNPTLEQVLTDFNPTADWEGLYLDARGEVHRRRLHLTSTGLFSRTTDGAVDQAGFVELVSWPDAAPQVVFRLCAPACGGEIRIAHPFKRFEVHHGPSSWPLVEYSRQ